MKKLFSLLLFVTLIIGYNTALAETNPTVQSIPTKEQMKQRFEQRLNLTDKQKVKARAIHQKGQEQMKPIITQIQEKRNEIEAVKLSKMAERMQQERIAELLQEIKDLEKKAREIRKSNSQEFEKILTKKQLNELAKMKAEGRAQFEKTHPARPPFQGLGAPGFLMPKPLFINPPERK